MIKFTKHFFLISCVIGLCLLVSAKSAFAENERYKAFPIIGGGSVFIIDTKEGHIWTWSNTGSSNASSSGKNDNILYQGNIRKNMNPKRQKINIPDIITTEPSRS